MALKQIDVSKPLAAYDEVLANAKNQGREPNTADRMLAMRAAILAHEADKSNVLPPTRGTDSQHSAPVAALTDAEIDAITNKHSTSLGGWEWSGDIIDVGAGRDYDFARDIEAEVAGRFRAQGGITKDPKR